MTSAQVNRNILATLTLVLSAACSSDRSIAPSRSDALAADNLVPLVASGDTGFWTTKASLPTQRYKVEVGVINGILYAVGGIAIGPNGNGSGTISTETGTVEAYNPTTNTWTTKASMPTPRTCFSVGVINGVLYAVGGYTGIFKTDAVEAYNPTTDTWTTKAPMPTSRTCLSVGVINGILYAVGGIDNTLKYSTTVEAYNPTTDTWTTKAPMPTSRAAFGVGVVNGMLYAVGGLHSSIVTTAVEAYNPTTDMWTTKASLPAALEYPAVGVINGILYTAGGVDTLGNVAATVGAYDPTTNTWTTKASMPTPRYLAGAGVVDGVLYTVAGIDHTGNNVTTVEAFTPFTPLQFNFMGFFPPVHNPPAVNRVVAGRAIPIKFTLHGNQGLNVFAPDYPQSQKQSCDGAPTGVPTQTITAGSSRLMYDPTSDQYTYIWQTDKTWAGTCRMLNLGLTDGSIHQALFIFK